MESCVTRILGSRELLVARARQTTLDHLANQSRQKRRHFGACSSCILVDDHSELSVARSASISAECDFGLTST